MCYASDQVTSSSDEQVGRTPSEIVLSDDTGGSMLEDYWIYILKCSDGSLYTGCTNNLTRRLRAHLSGKASRYTRSRVPVTLAYSEKAADKGSALKREAQIKRLTRSEKLLLCRAFRAREKHSTC